jgi:hypothetical protein
MPAIIGKPAPAFKGPAIVDGEIKEISIADFKGEGAARVCLCVCCTRRERGGCHARSTAALRCRLHEARGGRAGALLCFLHSEAAHTSAQCSLCRRGVAHASGVPVAQCMHGGSSRSAAMTDDGATSPVVSLWVLAAAPTDPRTPLPKHCHMSCCVHCRRQILCALLLPPRLVSVRCGGRLCLASGQAARTPAPGHEVHHLRVAPLLRRTFVCPTEIVAFSDRLKEFQELNCNVVGCSVDRCARTRVRRARASCTPCHEIEATRAVHARALPPAAGFALRQIASGPTHAHTHTHTHTHTHARARARRTPVPSNHPRPRRHHRRCRRHHRRHTPATSRTCRGSTRRAARAAWAAAPTRCCQTSPSRSCATMRCSSRTGQTRASRCGAWRVSSARACACARVCMCACVDVRCACTPQAALHARRHTLQRLVPHASGLC